MTATLTEEQPRSVPLDARAFCTTCPMVPASNVDQELGWTGGEFKKIGVDYPYFRSRNENNSYPHYVHNLDNLIRMGASTRRSTSTPASAGPGCTARRRAPAGPSVHRARLCRPMKGCRLREHRR